MLARVNSGALVGVEALPVQVEVNSGERGEPKTFVVGLPDAAVKESINRVSSALSNSGFSMPFTKMTVNLAPGDIKKKGRYTTSRYASVFSLPPESSMKPS